MTKIEINDLKFTYPGDNFGLDIKHLTFSGGMIAIIGQNGAGKSTLLKLLSGLNQPDSGEITVDGQKLNDYIGDRRLERIGLTFQDPNDQIFNATVKKEVEWGLRQMGRPEEEVEHIAEEVLKEVGLDDKKDENPYDLSLSERKLLSIATVVAVRPRILLFDEPMMSLDWPSRKKITAVFRYLADQGHVVITITHDMDWVLEEYEEVYAMAHGELIYSGRTSEFFESPDLVEEVGVLLPRVTEVRRELNKYLKEK
ncbi:energy-coupling factor ABC transporter ATP-binding protein [Ligilactobacillus sp.]|uniref:energy-coupling factor ABC transporter ATP-binding protein n=1 Tax=Ligilactobacillus sp. TaxID=2767921 RepID=UPI002FE3EA1A